MSTDKSNDATTTGTARLALTETAAARIRDQLSQRGRGIGLRVSVRRSGCSGYAYAMSYADEVTDNDDVFTAHGATIVVDHDNMPLLEGTTVDYRRDGLNSVFKFDNPQAREACGCGESFVV